MKDYLCILIFCVGFLGERAGAKTDYNMDVPENSITVLSCSHYRLSEPSEYGWRRTSCTGNGTSLTSVDFKNGDMVHDNMTSPKLRRPIRVKMTLTSDKINLTIRFPMTAETTGLYQCYVVMNGREYVGSGMVASLRITITLVFAFQSLYINCTVPSELPDGTMRLNTNRSDEQPFSSLNISDNERRSTFWNVDASKIEGTRQCTFQISHCTRYTLQSSQLVSGFDTVSGEQHMYMFDGVLNNWLRCGMDAIGKGNPKAYWSVNRSLTMLNYDSNFDRRTDMLWVRPARTKVYCNVAQYDEARTLFTEFVFSRKENTRCVYTALFVNHPVTAAICGILWEDAVHARLFFIPAELPPGNADWIIPQRGKVYMGRKYKKHYIYELVTIYFMLNICILQLTTLSVMTNRTLMYQKNKMIVRVQPPLTGTVFCEKSRCLERECFFSACSW